MSDQLAERRRRLLYRALPALAVVAVGSLAGGVLVASMAGSGAERAARDFTRAWQRADYDAMHALMTEKAQASYGLRDFEREYVRALTTASAARLRAADPAGEDDGEVRVPIAVDTRAFGVVRAELRVPVEEERVEWAPHLVFPGLRRGERLTRRTEPPRRAAILSRDRKVLATGPADERTSPLGELGSSIAGRMGRAESADERAILYARGFPRSTPVGLTGLERAFETELAGRPGGELLAGPRVLARSVPRAGRRIRTTIDPRLQQAAVTALAGRFGGIAVLDARTAEVLALAGIAFSAPQPPGSTFKLVTATAALEARVVDPETRFPVQTEAIIDGVPLENANGESCGGTFRNSFAHSCNSVFAPLGVEVGAKRLVDAAERYGWNAPPTIRGEVASTLPPAGRIRTPLEVGSTAIGQGKVLATPLRLASVAQALAAGGVRTEPTLRPRGGRARRKRVTSRRVAGTIRDFMVDVVGYGTGPDADEPQPNDPTDTDAWFTAFAPAEDPKVVVAVLLVRSGAGGATAAPAARVVLGEALKEAEDVQD